MGYHEIATMAEDNDLTARVRACAAQEVDDDPFQWTNNHMLKVCSAAGWVDAWSAAAAARTPTPGRNPGVITDGMVLAAVQGIAADDPAGT